MTIIFQKDKNNRTSLRCEREDGSSTYAVFKSPALAYHDLAHVAVERNLGFQKAFFGLLAEGHNITDFEVKRKDRPVELLPVNLPIEALQTEHIVNLLITEQFNAGPLPDFLITLENGLTSAALPMPAQLNANALDHIRRDFSEIHVQWDTLPFEQSLTFCFPWD